MNTNIQKDFHRNGQLRSEVPLRKGQRHGICRIWHKNGVLASQEPYQAGRLHGVCRQWDEAGHLLGKYKMVHGTGIQREWHRNGRLQMEISTVRGEFSGFSRIWLWDGTLLSENLYLRGQDVNVELYRAAAAKDKSLPKLRGRPSKLPPESPARTKHIYLVFVSSMLARPNRSEARKWLRKKSGDQTARSLGRLKLERDAEKFVRSLYDAGAITVILPDIYKNKTGDQFGDCLLVRLPKNVALRKSIRQVCARLRRRTGGAMEPEEDIGEGYLYLYFG
jgi:MORN repeat variant